MSSLRLHVADARRAFAAARALGLERVELEVQERGGELAALVVTNGEALASLAPAGVPVHGAPIPAYAKLLEATQGRGAVEVDYQALSDGLERARNLARKPPRFGGRKGAPVDVTILGAPGEGLRIDAVKVAGLDVGDGRFFSLDPVRIDSDRLAALLDATFSWVAHPGFRLEVREGDGATGSFLLFLPSSWRAQEEHAARLGFVAIAEVHEGTRRKTRGAGLQ